LIFFSHIDKNQESWCLCSYNQDSISSDYLELDQYQTIDKLTNFHFNEIEFEYECYPDLQICDSVSNFESMLTPISLPNLDPVPEPTLILVPIYLEREPPSLNSHIPLSLEHEPPSFSSHINFNSLTWTKLLNQS